MSAAGTFKPISEIITLKGKSAIITGGADGIGFAMAYRLAESGAKVLIADTNTEQGEQSAQALREQGFTALFHSCDVLKEDQVRKTVEYAHSEFGSIDILINNAGIFPHISLQDMTVTDFERVMGINCTGAFLCAREAARIMSEQRKGVIINIASIDGIHPTSEGLTAYDTSKGGIIMMTKSMARELGRQNIRVNAIAPGAIKTRGAMAAMRGTSAVDGRKKLKEMMSRMALGHMGVADDIGRAALFLASDLSEYMTGSVVVVDGGFLIS